MLLFIVHFILYLVICRWITKNYYIVVIIINVVASTDAAPHLFN